MYWVRNLVEIRQKVKCFSFNHDILKIFGLYVLLRFKPVMIHEAYLFYLLHLLCGIKKGFKYIIFLFFFFTKNVTAARLDISLLLVVTVQPEKSCGWEAFLIFMSHFSFLFL